MMESINQCDVLCILFAPLEDYPSSKFQSEILAESGLQVTVIDRHSDSIVDTLQNIHRIRVQQNPSIKKNRWQLLQDYLSFRNIVRQTIQRLKPKVIIAYDTLGIYLTGKPWKYHSCKVIWHFHELPGVLCNEHSGILMHHAENFSIKYAHKPQLLSFPDSSRAEFFTKHCKQAAPAITVMNCPRKDSSFLHSKTNFREQLKLTAKPIIHFHGSITESRCLTSVISSMPAWLNDAQLLLIGPIHPTYQNNLETLATQMGVKGRLKIIKKMPYDAVLTIASQTDIGLSIVENSKHPAWQYSAGAVNKRFEYMSIALPQITNKGIGLAEILENPPCGILLQSYNAEEISMVVNQLLDDSQLRNTLGENGHQKFLTTYHYEKQFEPLKSKILSWL